MDLTVIAIGGIFIIVIMVVSLALGFVYGVDRGKRRDAEQLDLMKAHVTTVQEILERYLSSLDGYYADQSEMNCTRKCKDRRNPDITIDDKRIKIILNDPRIMDRIMEDIKNTIDEDGEPAPENSEELEQAKDIKTCGSCKEFDRDDDNDESEDATGTCQMMGRDDDGHEKANSEACAKHEALEPVEEGA